MLPDLLLHLVIFERFDYFFIFSEQNIFSKWKCTQMCVELCKMGAVCVALYIWQGGVLGLKVVHWKLT